MLMLLAASALGQPMEESTRPSPRTSSLRATTPEWTNALKSTSADIKLVGVIADVIVTQVYKNEGKRPLEAIYIFPDASTRAAVYGMKMTIGKRTLIAKISKRDKEARRQYEEAKQQRKRLPVRTTETQCRSQMKRRQHLARRRNPGGDEIYRAPGPNRWDLRICLSNRRLGPRYSNQPAETALPPQKWVENPYSTPG